MPTYLSASQLHFAYDERVILRDINLQLPGAQLVGLIGPNGAGKSTLLRLLLGISNADAGTISLLGQSLQGLRRQQLARLITLVPQDGQIHYAFSVQEIVAMGRHPWRARFQPHTAEDQRIIEQAMVQTGILAFAKRPVNQLSGGERQRVLIARAIAQQTPIILLDEATANLDICHQLEVLELAQSLARQGHLVLAAIHDLNMAARFCDRLLLLAEQQIQADGQPAEVITESNLQQFFHLHAKVRISLPSGTEPCGALITPLSSVKPSPILPISDGIYSME